jgi:two-component system OmpR family sensor kinase
MSLRRRVIIGFVAVALVLVVSNIALSSTFRGYLLRRIDHQLVANAEQFRRPGPAFPVGGESGGDALTEYFVAVGDPSTGQLSQLNSLFDPEQSPPPKLTIQGITDHVTTPGEGVEPYTAPAAIGNGQWRMVAVSNSYVDRVAVLGISLDAMNATVARMREIQILGALAVLVALGFVSSWVMRLGVHPIAAMADTAEQISGSADLSLRVAHPDTATEAGRLGQALNSMLERIQDAFRAREASEGKVRRFAADASHELRTPLTSIRGYAELYRAGALTSPDDLADAMRRIEGEAARMTSLVEELLQLARLDQEQAMEFGAVDLGDIARDAVNDARAVDPDRSISVTVESDEPVVVRGNEAALRQVLANLLGNVHAHTPPTAAATVTVRRDGDDAVIAVRDAGPGMPADVAAHVFERFYRADAARTREVGAGARRLGDGHVGSRGRDVFRGPTPRDHVAGPQQVLRNAVHDRRMETTTLVGEEVATPEPAPGPVAPETTSTSPAWWQRPVALVAVALLSGGTAALATHALDGRGATTVFSAQPDSATRSLALSGEKLDVASVVAKVGPSVVGIRATLQSGPFAESAAGTGVIISSDGEILTNAHVVDSAATVKVTLAGEAQARDAQVVGTDAANDLALLKIADVSGLPAASLGDSDDVRVGDDVVAIGNALALRGGPTVTRGIVSGLDRSLETSEATMTGLLQTDASISSGNSGGPLVDATGKVIGINTAVAASGGGTAAENIGFAIAIDTAKPIIERLRNHTAAPAAGYLGVTTGDPTDGSRGALVRSVEPGSAAARAGLQQGDLITAIDGKSVDGAAALSAAIRSHAPGTPVKITYVRGSGEHTATADLGTRPSS